MKINDIRALSDKDLKLKLDELSLELVKLNSQAATKTQMKSPGKIKQLKLVRSRLLTVFKERGVLKHE
ncbi:MAG: 50S ribosomal protein L29 [Candidatus Woesearchaeota archaeon]